MYITKAKRNGVGSTGWDVKIHNDDTVGNMAIVHLEIGVLANEKGLFIGGNAMISWDELENAKSYAETHEREMKRILNNRTKSDH